MKNYFKNTIKCTDLEEYKKLPLEARTTKKKYWPGHWYLLPMGLPVNLEDFEPGGISEWDKCYSFLREQFPVQTFIRNDWRELKPVVWVRFNLRFFNDEVMYKVKCFFSPRNKEIAKQIPREWKASSEIIKDVLYAVFLQDYGEGKDGWLEFDEGAPNEAREYWKNQHAEYTRIANWIRIEKPALEKELGKAWENVSREKGLTYEVRYGKVNELERKIEDGDNEALCWIVKNRIRMD